MWGRIFERTIRHIIRRGTLHVTLPDGRTFTAGDGNAPEIAVRITDPSLLRRIVLLPDMGLGEGYMDGGLTIEGDDIRGLLELGVSNIWADNHLRLNGPAHRIRQRLRAVDQWNTARRARANVAHHYDLSAELYDIFLDRDRQYSCAYFLHDTDTLEEAQEQKKAHIAAKLLLEPGMRVLDIGCGWGGMALTLARDHGAHVTGVTLSEEQHAIATRRAAEAGLADRCDFRLMDYRALDGTFDRIVSVGMFEHVGVPHYDEYFGRVHDLLPEDGIALIHTIGRCGPPGTTSAWIAKYIFPGGYVPALSEMSAAFERAGLTATDVEVWRLHYAKTLRHWDDRFVAGIEKARALYDDRFCRMWRFYLIACEMTFRYGGQVVFQAQLARDKAQVPITREYLYPHPLEREMARAAE
ncbi:cyclopropane-fatty-acyl-phospholipid synthase [Oceaniovalibus guishaninsula JLT2003]|uniref:Cyclopropane-fatty-acyl-phospholipid synthase n=1 Tax=Oceaniovalibus guishaninsula JLT2003 TaxID=1231392 RepID=K2HC88_9RHOB|nr:cyclopropane-fatty-acyl-phospholipid synthase family protein [Oceaniovalibus guishaninsula]EKE44227.1 cyclopropane-fatty-acyl-phospholipid synthase [Oceaniovalibus guishaninsula JLT2003]